MPDVRGSFTPFASPADLPWLVAVGSSNVAAFRWWPIGGQEQAYRWWLDNLDTGGLDVQGVLEVRFLNGSVYQYYPVGRAVYVSMVRAKSRGQFVHQILRQGGFPYVKVS